MSETLQLARQVAAKDLSWVKAVGKEEKFVLAAQATLDAIDAAIAAEVPSKKPEPIRIPIEVDVSGLKSIDPNTLPELRIDLGEGKARIWAETKSLARIVEMAHELRIGEFATGGIATGPESLGVVGERPGETIISCDAPARSEDDVLASFRFDRIPEPWKVDLGEVYEVVSVSDSGGIVRSLGKIVEIFENGEPKQWLYRVEVERAAHCALEHGANVRDIRERHQRIGSLVRVDRLRCL